MTLRFPFGHFYDEATRSLDVDTTTDVYALGVLLYELLTGSLPFDPERLLEAGFAEMQRIIKEEDPAKPSTRISSLGDTATEIGELRNSTPAVLERWLRGDMDWITLKALEKDRTRRYGSASELAADINRNLNDEPVLASPPSKLYRLKKFARRHRVGVAAGSLVLLALVMGIVGTSLGLVQAQRAEAVAQQEAETAKQVSDFLVEIFEVVNPSEARGNTVTAREILDRAAKRIETGLSDEPEIQATLMDTLGRVYTRLGLLVDASGWLEKSLETRRQLFGDQSLEVASSLYHIGELYHVKNEWNNGEEPALKSLAIREALLGDDNLDLAASRHQTGDFFAHQRKEFDRALELIRQGLETQRRVLGNEHPDTAASLADLGFALSWGMNRFEEGEQHLIEALETPWSRKSSQTDQEVSSSE